jgi:NADH:ubiquinone oxidoreductase subunit F (NADH-binding)
VTAAAAAAPLHTGAARLLRGLQPQALGLEGHLRAYGRFAPQGKSLLEALEASGLTGRGGAAFPTAAKVRAVTGQRGRPVVVVNAAEGEPTSGKDRLLVRRLPHLVLDGAVSLAVALGAVEIVVALSASSTREADAVRSALGERPRAGRIAFRLASVPVGFVTGQETAVVQHLNGRPARPTVTPPLPFESGVGRRPTLVQNAETVAQVALIDRFGSEWFRELGTAAEPGSRLFTVTGAVGRPGVREAELGTRLADLIAAAGGVTSRPRAFLIGGYAGAWIDARAAAPLTLEEAALRREGGTLGVGTVTVLPEHACGVCESARVLRYLTRESAGQCGPCVHGLAAMAQRLEQAGRRTAADDSALLRRWAAQVTGRGACRHPDGAARFVLSTLDVFGPELARHDRRRCTNAARAVLPVPGERL